ncbi:never in mitosis gene A-related kinase, putative [Ichthyophthirius multifiliis]|uniref:non-specific serine/threonine protein kinase n=1 Tax=Ichthyophthirius multifiliis TaxID=5932 RepID=G0QQ64_ICHMU|nr:never in mitosis gene A-related kinase, putative [Ichthyophthirius multifiliis]EGR32643.1 never in mitosis gene A-related kinase, putative [Ichthyophthirius multifiliis]|eukprot:XP_004036629.1 never in mitosis gene A-related kinase, putative [Ichthyophthirius multifiliis]
MENYQIIQQIGKGSFGIVQKVKRIQDNKILVSKEINYGKMSEGEKQQLVQEVNIIRELNHPNIVKYYDRIIDKKEKKIHIIMEYCEGGDLNTLLKKCKKTNDFIKEDAIWKIFTQIIFALNECHNRQKNKILHRDLKPANIFLDSQNNIKLGDFGLSRILGENSQFAETHVGTPYYMSPEQIQESQYNEKSDIWSLGCLLYEMAGLKHPFQANNHLALAIKIKGGSFDRIPFQYSEDLQQLILQMLNVNQELRPSVQDLMKLNQINFRLKEKEIRIFYQNVKFKEEKINKMKEYIEILQKRITEKENKNISLQNYIQKIENEISQFEIQQKNSFCEVTSQNLNKEYQKDNFKKLNQYINNNNNYKQNISNNRQNLSNIRSSLDNNRYSLSNLFQKKQDYHNNGYIQRVISISASNHNNELSNEYKQEQQKNQNNNNYKQYKTNFQQQNNYK